MNAMCEVSLDKQAERKGGEGGGKKIKRGKND